MTGRPLTEVVSVADAVHPRMRRILNVPTENMIGQIRLELTELENLVRRLTKQLKEQLEVR